MAKDDQQEAYERGLVASFLRVHDWVKFAEAKNAALLAFASAWTVAIGNILTKDPAAPAIYAGVLPVAGAMFLIAALISILSFMPRVDMRAFLAPDDASSRPENLLFYGEIRKIPIAEFPKKLRERYEPPKGKAATEEYLDDLACQIHINSSIADRKFFLFKVAVWIVMAGMMLVAWPGVKYLTLGAFRLLCGQ
jgi:hypothetical protein